MRPNDICYLCLMASFFSAEPVGSPSVPPSPVPEWKPLEISGTGFYGPDVLCSPQSTEGNTEH